MEIRRRLKTCLVGFLKASFSQFLQSEELDVMSEDIVFQQLNQGASDGDISKSLSQLEEKVPVQPKDLNVFQNDHHNERMNALGDRSKTSFIYKNDNVSLKLNEFPLLNDKSSNNKPNLNNKVYNDSVGFKNFKITKLNNKIISFNDNIFIRIISEAERTRLFQNFPSLSLLNKLKYGPNKHFSINNEIKLNKTQIYKIIKINNISNILFRNNNFCVSINFNANILNNNEKEKKPNLKKIFLNDFKLINKMRDNNKQVSIPDSIKKFLYSKFTEFSSTLLNKNAQSKEIEINTIIQNLIKSKRLPKFLIEGGLYFTKGQFLCHDIFHTTNSEINPSNCAPLSNRVPLSRTRTSDLIKKFKEIGELLFLNLNDNGGEMAKLVDELKLNNKKFPKDVIFSSGEFYQTITIKPTEMNKAESIHASDVYFGMGNFNIPSLIEKDNNLKLIFENKDYKYKLIDAIFYLNYLSENGKIIKPKSMSYDNYAMNYLINCGVINSVFSIEEATKLSIDDNEIWGPKLLDSLTKGSHYFNGCEEKLFEIKKRNFSDELDKINNIISRDLITVINKFYSLIESSGKNILGQMQITCKLIQEMNELKRANSNDDACLNSVIKFVCAILQDKHSSLCNNSLKYRINENSRIVCPDNQINKITETINDLSNLIKPLDETVKVLEPNDKIIHENVSEIIMQSKLNKCNSSDSIKSQLELNTKLNTSESHNLNEQLPIIDLTLFNEDASKSLPILKCPKCNSIENIEPFELGGDKITICKSCLKLFLDSPLTISNECVIDHKENDTTVLINQNTRSKDSKHLDTLAVQSYLSQKTKRRK